MATSVVFPRVQLFANNGRPLIGGRIHTYVAGSSTRAPTYKDAAKAQPNTNPIILDGRGEAAIYLADGVEYKFVVEDSKGALIFTQEPVYGAVWPNAADWPSDATLAYQYMLEAQTARDDAIAAASASGDFVFVEDLAAMAAELPLPDDTIVEVARDADHNDDRTRYVIEAGAPAFKLNLNWKLGSAVMGYASLPAAQAGATALGNGQRVVVDAGGARTEYVVQGHALKYVHSLPQGSGVLSARELMQHQSCELLLGSDEEGGLLYGGGGSALQGLVILDTADGPRLFVSQAVAGNTETASERARIICFAFDESGGGILPLAYTPELEIGHGQDLGGYVNGSGDVVLFTSSQPSDALPAGKGVSRILWRGAATTQADVSTFQLFGVAATEKMAEFSANAVGLSNDGKQILAVATREYDNGRTLFAFDRAGVEAAVSLLDINPVSMLALQGESPSSNATLQGVCADEYAIYLLFGYTAAFGRQNIAMYDWSGALLRQIDMETIRADNGINQLLGNGSWGHPVAQEPEGIAIYSGKLYTTLMDLWGQTGAIVSYLGSNYACINTTTAGIYPHVTNNWVLTSKPATHGEFNPATVYTSGVRTRRRKFLYSIQDKAAAPVDGLPLSGSIPIAHPGGSVNLRGNIVDMSYAYGQAFALQRWSESLRRYFPALELTASGYLNLYDTTIGADLGNFGGIRSVRSGGRQYTSLIGANGGGATGFTLNLYGAADSVYPGGASRLFNPTGQTVVETDAGGQTIFTSRDNTKAPIIGSRQAEGDVFVGRFGSSVRGSLQASTAAFRIVARSGHGVVLATSALVDDEPVERWRFAQDGVLHPVADAATNLARASLRINNSYFAVAPTVSSDSRLKQQKRALSDAEKAAAVEIRSLSCAYKINDAVNLKGEAARWHYGVMAQDVVAALERHGVDWTMCGFIGYDEWPEEYVDHEVVYRDSEVLDHDGKPMQILVREAWREKIRDAGNRYSVRYQELDWFLKAAAL